MDVGDVGVKGVRGSRGVCVEVQEGVAVGDQRVYGMQSLGLWCTWHRV